MRLTRVEARQELFEALDGNVGADVFQWLPRDRTGAYVAIENPGMRTEATEWVWPVRIYVPASEPTMSEAQKLLDAVTDRTVAALEARSYVYEQTPDQFSAELDLYLVEFLVSIPRQDIGQ